MHFGAGEAEQGAGGVITPPKIVQYVQLRCQYYLIMYYSIQFAPSMEGYLSHPCGVNILLFDMCESYNCFMRYKSN